MTTLSVRSCRESRQRKVSQVHAANQQHAQHRRLQQVQVVFDVADHFILHTDDFCLEPRAHQQVSIFWKELKIDLVKSVNSLSRLRDRHSRLQCRDHAPVIAVPRVVRSLLRREGEREP
jgi:hypothetical protein